MVQARNDDDDDDDDQYSTTSEHHRATAVLVTSYGAHQIMPYSPGVYVGFSSPFLNVLSRCRWVDKEHHRPLTGNKLHCLATEAHVCVCVNNLPKIVTYCQ